MTRTRPRGMLEPRILSLVEQYTEPDWKREIRQEIHGVHARYLHDGDGRLVAAIRTSPEQQLRDMAQHRTQAELK